MNKGLKDFLFRVRYGFRGVPLLFQGRTLRLDESLRRWSPQNEWDVQKEICEHLRPGDVFVDVGANFGLHALLGASCVGPGGHVYAFEPVPANCQLLERHIALNDFGGRMTLVPKAVAETAGGTLELHGVQEGLTFAASIGKRGAEDVVIKVPVTTLDEALAKRTKPVRLIKIDVEGAEHLVLRGMRQLIERDHPLLLIEVHTYALPAFGSSAEKLREDLAELGYAERVIDRIDGVEGAYFHAMYQANGNHPAKSAA